MADIARVLDKINATLGSANALLSPAGAVMGLIAGIQALIARRKAAGEDTRELEDLLVEFDAALTRLEDANARYWLLPAQEENTTSLG